MVVNTIRETPTSVAVNGPGFGERHESILQNMRSCPNDQTSPLERHRKRWSKKPVCH